MLVHVNPPVALKRVSYTTWYTHNADNLLVGLGLSAVGSRNLGAGPQHERASQQVNMTLTRHCCAITPTAGNKHSNLIHTAWK